MPLNMAAIKLAGGGKHGTNTVTTHTTVLAKSDAAQVVLVASVRLLSESGHGLPRVGTVVDARLGERLVRVRVRVRVRDRDRGLGFGAGFVSASEMRNRIDGTCGGR